MSAPSKPLLLAWVPGSRAGRAELRLLRLPSTDRSAHLQLLRRDSGDHVEVPLHPGADPGTVEADFSTLTGLNVGTWDAYVRMPGAPPVRIAAREAGLREAVPIEVGDAVLRPYPTRFGNLAVACVDPYEVRIDAVASEPDRITVTLSTGTAVLADVRLAVDLTGLNVYGRARLPVRPEWVSTGEPDPEAPEDVVTVLTIPSREVFAALHADGYYELDICVERTAPPSLRASLRRPPALRRLRIRALPDEVVPLPELPPDELGVRAITPYRIGRRQVGLRIVDGAILADVHEITVGDREITARLTVQSSGATPGAPESIVIGNRLSGVTQQIPCTAEDPSRLEFTIAGEVATALAEDGRYSVGLRIGDRDWIHGIGNHGQHRDRRRWWTFPAAVIDTVPTARLRPYFTLHDSLALISSALLELGPGTAAEIAETGALEITMGYRSHALPADPAVPDARSLVWWRGADSTGAGQHLEIAEQSVCTTTRPPTVTVRTPPGVPDRAAVLDAARRGRLGVVFDRAGGTVTGRLRTGGTPLEPPRGRVRTRVDRLRASARDRARLALYRVLARTLPIDRRRAAFQSFLGAGYADSPRAISECLARLSPTSRIVWFAKPGVDLELPPPARQVEIGSVRYFVELARARYFTANTNFPDHLIKRDRQRHLQTWHGTPLKRIGMDVPSTAPGYQLQDNPALHRRIARWDAMVSPSPFVTDVYRSAFRHDAEVLEVGYPRNDLLTAVRADPARASEIRHRLGLAPADTVVVYMPTWRDRTDAAAQRELPFSLRAFAERLGPDVTLLLRLHYTVSAVVNIPLDLPQIIDVSDYGDSAELLAIADVLITDYSSVFYDFAITDRPTVFFAYDLDDYELDERGFYWDFRHFAPGPIVRDPQGLLDEVARAVTVGEWSDDDRADAGEFTETFVPLDDGHAAERATRRFFAELVDG